MQLLANFWQGTIAFFFCVSCVLLILVILLQKGRGGGLASAFGGSGGYSAFGAKTGDVFTWITVALTGMFVLMAILGNYAFVPPPVVQAPPAQATPVSTPTPETQPG